VLSINAIDQRKNIKYISRSRYDVTLRHYLYVFDLIMRYFYEYVVSQWYFSGAKHG